MDIDLISARESLKAWENAAELHGYDGNVNAYILIEASQAFIRLRASDKDINRQNAYDKIVPENELDDAVHYEPGETFDQWMARCYNELYRRPDRQGRERRILCVKAQSLVAGDGFSEALRQGLLATLRKQLEDVGLLMLTHRRPEDDAERPDTKDADLLVDHAF